MTLDSFLAPEPDIGPVSYGGIRLHSPSPPGPIISGSVPLRLVSGPRVDMSWRAQGACAGKPVEWWVPSEETNAPPAEAVLACATCPVKERCRSHAVDHHEYGYWGGTTDRDRRSIRRRRPAS